ncbi:hypothetical protein HPB50_020157 [Hyalomma asiaticum]|uniref:Uncharacterized protein n=1 Tax=Hyalomma asiaticum TaxID=266040 RepID=A0ACB7TL99_HYAAI|nr:hypothetical protein HPB50_020157 [Hyalomma asiaticum]
MPTAAGPRAVTRRRASLGDFARLLAGARLRSDCAPAANETEKRGGSLATLARWNRGARVARPGACKWDFGDASARVGPSAGLATMPAERQREALSRN